MGKDAEQREPEKGPMQEYAWGFMHSKEGFIRQGRTAEMTESRANSCTMDLDRHRERKICGEESQEMSNLNVRGIARVHLVVLGPLKPMGPVSGYTLWLPER